MAVARIAAIVVGVSPIYPFTLESTIRSSTALPATEFESECSSFSSAPQSEGKRMGTSSFRQESSSMSDASSARGYSTIEGHTRERNSSNRATMSLYDSLGVNKNASAKEIKAAYRLAARRIHPDVVPAEQRKAATKAFLEIQRMYAILSDPQRRAAYDLSLSMKAFQSAGYSNRGPLTATSSWGFMPTLSSDPNSDAPSYKGRSDFVSRGLAWGSGFRSDEGIDLPKVAP